jgi:hypothetical protein
MDLKPTANRLALLRAAAEEKSRVYRCRDFDSGEVVAYLERPDQGELMVTARVDEQVKAGWLRSGAPTGPSWYARRPMLVTDAGRAVLAATEPISESSE